MAPIAPITFEQAGDCFHSLWTDAIRRRPVDTIYALLRVSGMQDANWDPYEESKEAFEDLNWHLKATGDGLSEKSPWRIGLLMYCQAVEMSVVHSTLANLLRILLDQPYHINPLGSLGRAHKRRVFKWYPPSATAKWKKLKNMAEEAERNDLVAMMDNVYYDEVRNAFSHSDYIITDRHFRWTEGGMPAQLPLEVVDTLINNSFQFFSRFMAMHQLWLRTAASLPRFTKWPNYEVLELLVAEGDEENDPDVYYDDEYDGPRIPNRKLVGFKVHFSNGNVATFSRSPERVVCDNVSIEPDGTINFFVGLLDALEQVWKVNGEPVDFGDNLAVNEFR